MFTHALEFLQTLKVVEYVGPKLDTPLFKLNRVRIIVLVYNMITTCRSLQSLEMPQAEVTMMPHSRFEGKWDE